MKKIFYSILLSGMMVLSACDVWGTERNVY